MNETDYAEIGLPKVLEEKRNCISASQVTGGKELKLVFNFSGSKYETSELYSKDVHPAGTRPSWLSTWLQIRCGAAQLQVRSFAACSAQRSLEATASSSARIAAAQTTEWLFIVQPSWVL